MIFEDICIALVPR